METNEASHDGGQRILLRDYGRDDETRVTDALAQLFFNLATRCGFSRVTSADRYDTGFEERIQTGQQAAECGVGCGCGKGKGVSQPVAASASLHCLPV
eukprot:scaffold3580_cov117-Alexandrium_tamarense.AAC.1